MIRKLFKTVTTETKYNSIATITFKQSVNTPFNTFIGISSLYRIKQ